MAAVRDHPGPAGEDAQRQMKNSTAVMLLILILGLTLAAAGGAWVSLRLHRALGVEKQRVDALTNRVERLALELKPFGEGLADVERRLAAASNRAVAAEAKYEQERKTHDPLRQQIERLTEKGALAAGDVARKDEQMAAMKRALEQSQTALSAAVASNRVFAASLEELSAEKQKTFGRQSELRTQVDTLASSLATVSNELTRTTLAVLAMDRRANAAEQSALTFSNEAATARSLLKEAQARIADQSNRLVRLEAASGKQ
jgi:chromosome segregation ATPase